MKRKIKPGTVVFIIFIAIILILLFSWCRESARNAEEVLERTAWVEDIKK